MIDINPLKQAIATYKGIDIKIKKAIKNKNQAAIQKYQTQFEEQRKVLLDVFLSCFSAFFEDYPSIVAISFHYYYSFYDDHLTHENYISEITIEGEPKPHIYGELEKFFKEIQEYNGYLFKSHGKITIFPEGMIFENLY